MKLTTIALGVATAAAIFITGCANTKTVSEESLGLRTTDLYSEKTTVPDKVSYSKDAPGTSKYIKRAFENAPPMIPHDVEGMIPITIGNNACLGCHEPAVAASMNATAIPATHFTNYRPDTALAKDGEIEKDGKVVENTSDVVLAKAKKLNQLSGARFNCTQCHAPQSNNGLEVKNDFQPDFRTKGTDSKSDLSKIIDEGVQTIK